MAYSDGTLFYKRAPISPTTAAVTAKAPFNVRGSAVIVAADNLAGAEEVDIFVKVGSGWETLVDSAGTARKLTATITMLTLEADAVYAVTKDATAGACGVFVSRQPA
jgi:hypothetical protein